MQDARADRGGRDVAARLVVVGQPVLEDGRGAPVRRVVAAQAAGVRGGDGRGELRVLRVALLVAAHRGWRRRLTVGAQTFSPTRSSRARIARVSLETASPTRRTRSVFQVAPRPTAWGKPVAGPIQATPWRASWPVRKAAMPRRSTAGVNWCRHPISSSRVSRDRRSSMRFANGSCGSRKGCVCADRWDSLIGGGKCFRSASMPVRHQGTGKTSTSLHQAGHTEGPSSTSDESWNRPLCAYGCSLNLAATSKRFDCESRRSDGMSASSSASSSHDTAADGPPPGVQVRHEGLMQ
ncbi:hypothetical protein STSP_06330 [Streptomyces jeddahensis]|uniref:Uncharacterized protein n=1 Tax=Streptomyces jeddahensis TaxID=1716141 RepID=A0A177HYM7_9ACTN|nr:hypothetical protein STSP_06330 [Streptomyces jeddahensis]